MFSIFFLSSIDFALTSFIMFSKMSVSLEDEKELLSRFIKRDVILIFNAVAIFSRVKRVGCFEPLSILLIKDGLIPVFFDRSINVKRSFFLNNFMFFPIVLYMFSFLAIKTLLYLFNYNRKKQKCQLLIAKKNLTNRIKFCIINLQNIKKGEYVG